MKGECGDAAARVFATNERVNQLLIAGLDPAVWRATGPGKVRAALAESGAKCVEMIQEALGGRISKFRRDGWGQAWPVGIEMVCYMISHEAHHRGQVCMLANQLGFPVGDEVTSRMWAWERLWREGK